MRIYFAIINMIGSTVVVVATATAAAVVVLAAVTVVPVALVTVTLLQLWSIAISFVPKVFSSLVAKLLN